MNSIMFSLLALIGLFDLITAIIPVAAYGPIILFVGLTINKDAASITPTRHLPAYLIGLFPVICDWLKGQGSGGYSEGILSLAKGEMLTSLLWSSLVVHVVDRHFIQASFWASAAAVSAFIGLIH